MWRRSLSSSSWLAMRQLDHDLGGALRWRLTGRSGWSGLGLISSRNRDAMRLSLISLGSCSGSSMGIV
jgi:hypothetical protein